MAIQRLPSTGDAPRSTGIPDSVVPGGAVDSAGFPWEGRSFDHHGTAFADDDGSTPPALLEAVDRIRERCGSDDLAALGEAHALAILALSNCRVLVPLLAEAGDLGTTPEGRTVEKTQELSIVTVQAPDGRRVMPVFSSVDTMRSWNPEARPIPVPGPQAALAAAQEGTDLIIVDAGSPASEFGVRRTALEAMATGKKALPAWADHDVLEAFRRSAAGNAQVTAIDLAAGDPTARLLTPETDVILTLAPGLRRDQLNALVSELQRSWAADSLIAQRVDSLRIVIRS